ncbi:MAG TPA: tetratricopeptide repeat protein [Polyangia bacterium]|nr:tetratricopeptide repeat protein [Polyangia bacterium]
MRILQVLMLVCLTSSIASADDARQTAKTLYSDGLKQYNLGHFEKALTAFEAAYNAVPDPVFLFNIGQCHRALDQAQEALLAYRAYLREAPNAPNREEVEKLRVELEQTLERRRQQQTRPPTGTLSPSDTPPTTAPTPSAPPPATTWTTPPPTATTSGEATATTTSGADLTTSAPSDDDQARRHKRLYWIIGGAAGVVVVGVALGVGLGVGLSSSHAPSPTFAKPVTTWSNNP